MTIKEYIDNPRFHHQWIPDAVAFESDFPEQTVNALKDKGYTITKRGRFGRMDGVMILKDGKRNAAGDKRGDDSVAGF
jgi:gamma-glutamyltranspeptidase/glutathione hydrolase